MTLRRILTLAAAGGAGLAWFYRDPERHPPEGGGLVVAPCDGRVVGVDGTAPRSPWGEAATTWNRIAIFLPLNEVHVQRAPVKGRITASAPEGGTYWPAFLGLAAANAGHWLAIDSDGPPVVVHRQSGVIARRVTTTVGVGEDVALGQRIGRILLGSRVEVYLPEGVRVIARAGHRVRAGETVIGTWSAW
jgi:phosphatidylserine decarboxylase